MNSQMRIFVVFLFLVSGGCASIVSKTKWPIVVSSTPVGASVTITNKKGNSVYRGNTPAVLTLKSGAGFFSKESYLVKISMPGYDEKMVPLECKLNGWYAGNILIGGIIGLLIIDPATGAMYKLSTEAIHEKLTMTSASAGPTLQILNVSQVPGNLREKLVKY
jgi:hypothetical protein